MLSRIDTRFEAVDRNTYVAKLAQFRERGAIGEFIHRVTYMPSDLLYPAGTAIKLLEHLVHGSPALRVILGELVTTKALKPIDP